ncbi:aquaporin [Sphingomonas sp. UNC305MFCol5.2]|uniref:aquaporin n=1 Tax=Sphingomonas sp. UNC305MFCol5.2 TaxID=1449076 RepID=UPI000A4729DE|nr:MIP/aquaporin family protein [Sphingomonas sp. UNC305MFCol5.2]
MTAPLARRLLAEGFGSAMLFAAVIGSGIMAERLAGGNVALALLANSAATGAMLFVLITILGPISGAHLNPAVSLVMAIRGALGWRDIAPYVLTQLLCGIAGAWLTHLMFEVPILQVSTHMRTGPGQWAGEAVATFGLVLTILGIARQRPSLVPAAVALYITAAYWFTSSTSFANPAITVARSLTDSFSGIAPRNVPMFILFQLAGALLGAMAVNVLFPKSFAREGERPLYPGALPKAD